MPVAVPIRVLASDTRQPVPAAQVWICIPGAGAWGSEARETVTDPAGAFDLGLVRPGAVLRILAEGYIPFERALTDSISDVVLLEPVLTEITVYAQPEQSPLPGAEIVYGEARAYTDARGQARLRALRRGLAIVVRAPGYEPVEVHYLGQAALTAGLSPIPTPTPTVTVTPTPTTTPAARATLRPTAPVTGTAPRPGAAPPAPNTARLVFYPQERLGSLRDTVAGRGVTNATLWLGREGACCEAAPVYTDGEGAFRFPEGVEGNLLTVKAAGYRLTRIAVGGGLLERTLQPFQTRGIHIYYAMPREAVLALLDRLKETEVNTVVIDVKSDRGEIVWPSSVPLARAVNAYMARGIDLKELLTVCRERDLYCIARTVVMKDDKVAYARPEWALHTASGAVYADKTAAWLNPAKREVTEYAVALARELVGLGFDEVQVDYIRYPGLFGAVEVGTPETRVANIKALVAAHRNAFRTLPAFLSADLFGLTTFTDDENNIGQRMRELGPLLDYVSPMVYPDTYNAGMLGALGIAGCSVPRACPYQTVYQNVKHAQTRAGTLIRVWIQAYGWTTAEYLQEKKAAEEAGSYGWLFWNNQGIYDTGLFRKR